MSFTNHGKDPRRLNGKEKKDTELETVTIEEETEKKPIEADADRAAAAKSGPVDEADVRKIIREEVLANPAYKELIRQEMSPYLLIKNQEKWNRVAEDKFMQEHLQEKTYKKFIRQEMRSSPAIKKLVQAEWNSAAVAELLSNPEIQNLVQAKTFMENPQIQKFFNEKAEKAAAKAFVKEKNLEIIRTEARTVALKACLSSEIQNVIEANDDLSDLTKGKTGK